METLKLRVGPRHPRLAKAGYRLTRRLAEAGMARVGFHRIDSEFARRTIASIRECLQRGETVYVAGLRRVRHAQHRRRADRGHAGGGPRIVVNNEEERFSGNKHTTEYPRRSIDAMVEQLRAIGRDVGDIAPVVTTWDYPVLLATLARTVLEEAPGSLKLLLQHRRHRPSIAAAWIRCGARRECSPSSSASPNTCR